MLRRCAGVLVAALLGACGGGMGTDAGAAPDAGSTDAAVMDAPGDAGEDAGPRDAAIDPTSCDAIPADVYAIDPASAGGAAPGEILGCAALGAWTAAELDAAILADDVPAATSGAARYLIAYRTERRPGVVGVGSALLLVPDAPRAGAPLVVVNHGTAGHADACAPSTREDADPDLVLPWAASGLATIAVDYAGLGTRGVQGYGDAFDTAQSVLDGARAALAFLGEERPIVITGHSQGGAATLFAQGLAPTYAPELAIERAIAFAGGSAGPAELTAAQARLLGLLPISGGLGANRAISAMLVYADFANGLGEARAGDGFHPDVRAEVVDAIESDCIFAMAARLATPSPGYVPPNTFGQLADPALLTAVEACVAGGAGCTPEGEAFVAQRTVRSYIPIDPAGGSILLISGSEDILHTPDEFGCVRESIEATGADLEACYLDGATHFDITRLGIGTALATVLGGTVTCPASATTPPACAP